MLGLTLLPFHRRMLTITFLVGAGAFASWYLLVFPLRSVVATERRRNDTNRDELKVYNYPLDPSKLAPLNKQLMDEKHKLFRRLTEVYDVAMGTFQKRLEPYGTIDGLRNSITYLDFSEKLDALRLKMNGLGMTLDDETLNLSTSESVYNTYRLVVHLWVLEDLVELVHKHKLDPRAESPVTRVNAETRESYTVTPSRFTVLPVTTYGIGPEYKQPFTEEFPIKFTVRGSLQDVSNLLTDLTSEGRFIPLERCLLKKLGVEEISANKRKFELVEATMTVSAFLILIEKNDIRGPAGGDVEGTNVPPWRPGH